MTETDVSDEYLAVEAPTARAFSLTAPIYDTEQARNQVARWSRTRSTRTLERTFKGGEKVLELGCGTGDEALHLARRGVSVIATDAAPGMLQILRRKLAGEDAKVRMRVTALGIAAGRAGELVSRYGKHSLDGAYSSFGPLNCEPDLGPVARALADLVKPGGRVTLSLINRYCLWETLWYLSARDPRRAFRRWSGRSVATVHAGRQHERIPVYYPSPGELKRAFDPHFRVVRRMALPWLLPPQYLSGIFQGRARLFKLLARVDSSLAGVWPFYLVGDHILIELARRPLR